MNWLAVNDVHKTSKGMAMRLHVLHVLLVRVMQKPSRLALERHLTRLSLRLSLLLHLSHQDVPLPLMSLLQVKKLLLHTRAASYSWHHTLHAGVTA
jgi:hypothetical protein